MEVERLEDPHCLSHGAKVRRTADAFDEGVTLFAAPPGDAYFEKLLSDSHFVMLAARINGTVVGALAAYELVKYEQERSEFYIYDLAVAEPFRRRGVARTLIEALKPIARSAGAGILRSSGSRGRTRRRPLPKLGH